MFIIKYIFKFLLFNFICVNCSILTLKNPTKCGDPGVPAYGKLLTNSVNIINRPSVNLFNQNDIVVNNFSEITIDLSNFNNGLEQNQITYDQGEIVSYTCFVGHLMIGSAHRKCLQNGKWSGNLPICDTLLDQFDLMNTIETPIELNSSIKNDFNNQVILAYSSNYLKFAPPELAVDHRFSTCFHSEKYGLRVLRLSLKKTMKILGVAITIPKENLDYNFNVFIANKNENFGKGKLCLTFEGTFATKTTILLCQNTFEGDHILIEDNTKKIQTFSICEVQVYIDKDEIECGEPELPTNAIVVNRSRFGHIEYQCKLGYYLIGPAIRQCQKNGLWSGEQPICSEIQCSEDNENNRMNNQQLSLQISAQLQSLHLNCEPGYQFMGIQNHSIVCLGDGRFDTRITPFCELVNCGSPLYVSEQVNGEFIPLVQNKTTFGSIAKLRCFDAHAQYSSQNILISCEASGQWSPPKAICLASHRSIGQTKHLKNRLGTLIVTILLILVLLILLLTIYLFKKRIILLAMNLNENKEVNLKKNPHLITPKTNFNANNNLDSINFNNDVCLEIESNSTSENNSSQPSSKSSIKQLIGKKLYSLNNVQKLNNKEQLQNFFKKLLSLIKFNSEKSKTYQETNSSREYKNNFPFTDHILNTESNPLFLKNCQFDTAVKQINCYPFHNSTSSNNQISLVRLQNKQRAERLMKYSNCQNSHSPFKRQKFLNSSFKSDSVLINSRRQLVRDQLVYNIESNKMKSSFDKKLKISKIENLENCEDLIKIKLIKSLDKSENNFNKKLIVNNLKHKKNLYTSTNFPFSDRKLSTEKNKKEFKNFYYFSQNCFTLPKNHQTNRNNIDHFIRPKTFDKSSDGDTLNTSDTASSISSNFDENNLSTFKPASLNNIKFLNENLIKIKNANTNNADEANIHLNVTKKRLKKKSNLQFIDQTFCESFKDKNLTNSISLNKTNEPLAENQDIKNNTSELDVKYIVIDDTVFAD